MLKPNVSGTQGRYGAFKQSYQRQEDDSLAQSSGVSKAGRIPRGPQFTCQEPLFNKALGCGVAVSSDPTYFPNDTGNLHSEDDFLIRFKKPQKFTVSSSPTDASDLDSDDTKRTHNPHPIPRTSRTSALTKLFREHQHQHTGDVRNAHHYQLAAKPQLRRCNTGTERNDAASANHVQPDLAAGLRHHVQLQPQFDVTSDAYTHDPQGVLESFSPPTSPSLHPSTPDSRSSSSPSPRLSHSSSTSGLWMKGTFTGLNDKEES